MDKDFFKKKEFKIFLTVLLVYAFFISDYGGNWMADSMLSGTLALVNNHTFVADSYIKQGCEIIGCDYAFYEGHFYSGFAPGMSLIAVPVIFLFKPLFMLLPDSFAGYTSNYLSLVLANILATVFISSVFGALLVVLLYRFSWYFTKNSKIRLLTAFSFAFGTLFFVYSTEYASRVIATFFSFYAFYLLFKNKHLGIKNSSLFFSGLFCGLAVFIEYTQAIVVFFLGVYLLAFLRNKKILYFFGGMIIFLGLLASYHYLIFGTPFTTSYYHLIQEDNIKYFGSGLEYTIFSTFHGPKLESLWGLSFSLEKGAFIYMPILLLSIFGISLVLKNQKHKYYIETLLSLFIFLAFLLYNSSLYFWTANCGFGPRLMMASFPFLMLPLIFAYEKVKFKIATIFAGLSIFINFLPNLYGTTVLWQSFIGTGCNSTNAIFREYLPLIFKRGLTNYTLNLIKFKLYDLPIYLMNLIALCGLFVLGLIIWFIWKK